MALLEQVMSKQPHLFFNIMTSITDQRTYTSTLCKAFDKVFHEIIIDKWQNVG